MVETRRCGESRNRETRLHRKQNDLTKREEKRNKKTTALKKNYCWYILFLSATIAYCKATKNFKTSVHTDQSYHSSYDDTTLTIDNSSLLMPFNRFIDPAGTVIHFGNKSLENHSLDCALLPGKKVLVVEDRYGIAFIDLETYKLLYHLDYEGKYKGLMSTYSGIKAFELNGKVHIFWGASVPDQGKESYVMEAIWDGKKAVMTDPILFDAVSHSPMALPNDIAINIENGVAYLYVVLNGNNQLSKLRLQDKKIIWTTTTGMAPFGVALTSSKAYVSNWAGSIPTDPSKETAGIPYMQVYTDPRTGATISGTVTVIDLSSGKNLHEISVGLHPNAVLASKDNKFVFVSNGNSDNVSVISTSDEKVVETISVRLAESENKFIGDSPNGLAIDANGTTLFVSNGMDNAVAVVRLGKEASLSGNGKSRVAGFIPTEAYPAGLVFDQDVLYVSNLEGQGARVHNEKGFSIHQQEASVSVIALPDEALLKNYTKRTKAANLMFRTKVSRLLPRRGYCT